MKVNEIIARQNRIIYILLVVTAVLGLTWTIWRHQHLAEAEASLAAPVAPPAAQGPAGSGR